MATIKTREFKHTALSGEVMHFKASITVDASGVFTVNIPEELAPSARALNNTEAWKGRVVVDLARVNWRVQGRVLSEVERFVEDAVKEHLTVEIKRELVIRYRYENNTTWARAADGSIHPNGHWASREGEHDETQRSWVWAGNRSISATSRPTLFGVGVVAQVYMKVTYSRPSGTRVEYTSDLPGSHWDKNPMRRLNGFIVGAPDRSGDGRVVRSGNEPCYGIQEMPYSDAAADFFADLMLAMCRLGEQLDAFVGSREMLAIAIDRGSKLISQTPTSEVQAT